MERGDLAKIVDFIIEKDLIVISDEIYSELTYTDEGHVSIASFDGMKEIQDYNRPLNPKFKDLYNGRTSAEVL